MGEDKIDKNEELSPEKLAEFLSQKKLIDIINSYNEECIKAEKKVGFNIFRMLSDFYYRENFHGDILEIYLNPEGYHGEGDKFLRLFLLKILGKDKNCFYGAKSKLIREYSIKGNRRIDFVIVNENKDHCVVIENKLYDAVDMDNQLPAYVDAMKEKYGTDSVDAVIYLPLSSDKVPDKSTWEKDIEPILEIVSAEKLIKDWLDPSIGECEIVDNKVILRHYKVLLESLIPNKKKNDIMGKLLKFLREKEGELNNAIAIKDMLNGMSAHMEEDIRCRLKNNLDDLQSQLKISSTDWSKCVIEIPATKDVVYLQCELKDENAYKVFLTVDGVFNIYDNEELKKSLDKRGLNTLNTEMTSEPQPGLKNALRLVKTFDFDKDGEVLDFLENLIKNLIQCKS